MMQLHLDEISAQLPPHVHAAMIADGAGWHRSHALGIPNNITLIDIPPATPACNRAEKPWQYLKDTFLSHPVFHTYNAILDACEHAWNRLIQEKGRIASLTETRHLLCHET
jgi:putative transposase